MTKEIKQHCDLLKDTIEETCDIAIAFENSESIAKMAKIMPNHGTVSVTKSQDSLSDPGTVAIYTGELMPKTDTDTAVPIITSYEMLPDGRQLITDQNKKKLKLYDSNNQFISELALINTPYGMSCYSTIMKQ